jgi:hypothetical protein
LGFEGFGFGECTVTDRGPSGVLAHPGVKLGGEACPFLFGAFSCSCVFAVGLGRFPTCTLGQDPSWIRGKFWGGRGF